MKIPIYSKSFPWPAIKYYSKVHGVEIQMIASIIQVESGGNEWAFRYEPNYKWTHDTNILQHRWKCSGPTALLVQQCSYGLMQIMGATYLDLGGHEIPTTLFEVENNIDYATRHFKNQLEKYNNNVMDSYAAYNAGIAKKIKGVYQNEWAVKKFREVYLQFIGEKEVTRVEI